MSNTLTIVGSVCAAIATASLVGYAMSGAPSNPCIKVFGVHDIITHKTFGRTIVESVATWGDDKNFCNIMVPFPGLKRQWFSPQDFEEFQKKSA